MLTAAEAAAQLGVKLGTLYAYVSRGWLKSYRRKVGREALYRRSDIEALRGVTMPERGRRARSLPDASSWVTVAQPPAAEGSSAGVIVAESAVSSIVEGRQLAYRGYPIEELVERATFEQVCLLLWNGERPAPPEVAHLTRDIAAARMPAAVAAALSAVGRDAAPLLRLAVMMPVLAAAERRHPARSRLDDARLIISVMPLALAPAACPRDGRAASKPEITGIAARLLIGSFGPGFAEWERKALDHVLIACAEHELNASTFAARVVASTGADLFASVLAALCSLSGPIHGGACDRIEGMFADLESGARLEDLLAAYDEKHLLPPGFGHAIYPDGDPRAALLKKVAATIARRNASEARLPRLAKRGRRAERASESASCVEIKSEQASPRAASRLNSRRVRDLRQDNFYETALKVEEAVWKREHLRPNLDFYLTVCTRMLGFARGLPAAIFAVGRTAGWIAHSLEQYADNRLIRPRMRYRGSPLRHWEA